MLRVLKKEYFMNTLEETTAELEHLYQLYGNNNGFLCPKLNIDIPLYRYRSNMEYIIDEIEHQYIHLTDLSSLNDPFDSSCVVSYEEALKQQYPFSFFLNSCDFLCKYEWYNSVRQDAQAKWSDTVSLEEFSSIVSSLIPSDIPSCLKHPASISEIYYERCLWFPEKRFPAGKVACFSERNNSLPMWSYYANSHYGVCFKYDLQMLDLSDPVYEITKNSIHKVWYSDICHEDKDGTFSPFFKSQEWSHEQEWRLFRTSGDSHLYFPCMTEIYLGVNYSGTLNDIALAIEKSGHKIKLYKALPARDSFKLRFMEIYL